MQIWLWEQLFLRLRVVEAPHRHGLGARIATFLCKGATMKTIKISDEVYDRLKEFVVDPFDDTPQSVIGRLVEIADKAKQRWSAFEPEPSDGQQPHQPSMADRVRITNQSAEDGEVIL